jgi:hypothetical protein
MVDLGLRRWREVRRAASTWALFRGSTENLAWSWGATRRLLGEARNSAQDGLFLDWAMGARTWFGSVGLAVAIAVACYLVALCDFQRSWQSKKLLRNQKRRQYRKSKCGGLLATRGLVLFCPMKRDIRAWQYEKG